MPNADLAKIIQDTGTFQAAYLPVQNPGGGNATKPSECNIPAFDDTPINPDVITPVDILKDCIIDFIPVPIVPTPYFNVDDVTNPCPSGFTFDSTISGAGTIYHAGTGVDYLIINGVGSQFITEIKNLVDAPNYSPWPMLEVESAGVKYRARVNAVINANQLHVEDVFTSTSGSTFTMPTTSGTAIAYKIIRIVFTTSTTEPTSGDLFIINNPSGCGGSMVGEINILATDIVDCPSFDITAGSGINITMPDGSVKTIGVNVNDSVSCAWAINLTAPTITFPPYPTVPCSGNPPTVSITDGTVAVRTYAPNGSFSDVNLTLGVTDAATCNPKFSIDYNGNQPIIIPAISFLAGSPHYFNMPVTLINGVYTINPGLYYDGGTDIQDSQLYKDIKEALQDDGDLGGCNGCAVWA